MTNTMKFDDSNYKDGTMYAVQVEINNLRDRIDNHSKKLDESSCKMFSKIDEIKDIISENKIQAIHERQKDKEELLEKIGEAEKISLRDNKELSVKQSALSATLGSMAGFLTAWASKHF